MQESEVNDWIQRVNNMSHTQLAHLWRFAKPGHPVFRDDLPIYTIFRKRFESFGGMTPEISKQIGWDRL